MASLGTWDKILPSGTSALSEGDGNIRSNQSSVQAALEEEHFFTDSTASTGIHKLGSARAFVGAHSAIAHLGADSQGRVYWSTDTGELLANDGSAFTVTGHAWQGARVSDPSGFAAEQGTWTILTYADTEYDFGGMFDSGTSSKISIQATGMYTFAANVKAETGTSRLQVAIAKGDPTSATNLLAVNSIATVFAGNSGNLNVSGTAFLAAGTILSTYVNGTDDSGSSLSFAISGSESSEYNFSVTRVA